MAGKKPLSLYERFAQHIDVHQTPMYARVMEGIGWRVEGDPGSQIFVRKLGPVSIIKMQRSGVFELDKLQKMRKDLRAVLFQIEPALLVKAGKKEVLFPQTYDPKYDISYWKQEMKEIGLKKVVMPLAHSATSIIDLRPSEQALLSNMKRVTRYNIGLAHRRGLQIHTILLNTFEKHDEQRFFAVLNEWSHRKHVFGFEEGLMRSVIAGFKKESWCHFAELNGKLESVALMLKSGEHAIYYCAVSSVNGYKNRVPTALVWECMKTAKQHGCSVLDFGGIADPRYPGTYKRWNGFTTFKEGFAPTPFLYPLSFRLQAGWW